MFVARSWPHHFGSASSTVDCMHVLFKCSDNLFKEIRDLNFEVVVQVEFVVPLTIIYNETYNYYW